MRRRELLRTAGFAAGLTLAGQSGAETPADPPDRWFLDWLPPSLVGGDAAYSFGTSPVAADGPRYPESGDRHLHLTTAHATLTVSTGVDPAGVRETLRADGYERRSDRRLESYGRSAGRRHRVAALDDGALVTGFGPAPELVADRVHAVARTDGLTAPGGVLEGVFEHVSPGRHLSVDIRPVEGIAGVGERIVVGEDRSRLRTVAVPDPSASDPAGDYLHDLGSVDGVLSTSKRRHRGATVREATVRTDSLRARLEGGA